MKDKAEIGIRPDRRGMTLVELMIALLVFGIIMSVVFGFMVGSRDSYEETRGRARYQQGIRAAFSLLTQEVRSAGCDPTQAGFERVAAAAAAQMRCQSDLNADGDATDTAPDESVTYSFNAGTGELSRDNGTGAVVILRELENCMFTYFDGDGNVLNTLPLGATDRARVREVQIDINGVAAEGDTVRYATRIAMRNG